MIHKIKNLFIDLDKVVAIYDYDIYISIYTIDNMHFQPTASNNPETKYDDFRIMVDELITAWVKHNNYKEV